MPANNEQLARLFNTIADALELKGETGFRVLAYRRAARELADLAEDVADLDKAGKLTTIQGIGEGIAKKIHEYLSTGRMNKYEEATAGIAPELLKLLQIQGLGPRTLKLLHEQLGVDSREKLKEVLKDGRAARLPGLGDKRVQNILRAMRLADMAGERMFLNEAMELAESVKTHLEALPGVTRVTPAGSLRRGRETIGDIDILVTGRNPKAIIRRFVSHPLVKQVLGQGTTKATCLFETRSGLRQVDVRVIPNASYGAALQYFTGSKDHNVALRTLARKQGLKLSEYGVFQDKRLVAGKSEPEVYAAVGLPYIEPELREDRGEIQAALEGQLPRLVRLEDIRCDLHMHTRLSDGSAEPEQMAEECRRRGYTHIAIAEHSASVTYAGGLSEDALLRHCDWVDRFNAKSRGFRILKASEVDITVEARLDYSDKTLERLDFVIASIHQGFKKNATERICFALEHPLVHMIAHPSGRIIGRREGYDIDLEKVIECAARNAKILELNAFYARLDLSDIWARKAKEAGVKLAINTDAHAVADLDWMKYGVLTARRAWLEKADVVNCLSYTRLLKLLSDIRTR
ncbi:MAG: DNA polymerase/3'-5' exonuclease PolX [candidate division WOR-3 bacterium]